MVADSDRRAAEEALRRLPEARSLTGPVLFRNKQEEMLRTGWRWVPVSQNEFYVFVRDLRAPTRFEAPTETGQELTTFGRTAPASLREGMEELFTLQRLGVRDVALPGSLSSTNMIESAFARCEAWTSRVSHWRGQHKAKRWAAGVLLWAEGHFQRIKGHTAFPALEAALKSTLDSQQQVA